MSKNTTIVGFTLLRNGIKYDYCFRETLKSLSLLTSDVFVALGKSEDGTEVAVSQMPFVHIIETVWDENLRSGGLILSQQTNIALNAAREAFLNQENVWGLYLQCDEVLHQEDIDLIKSDIEKANQEGHDAISFRYWHFWQSHGQVAINKKWYPEEIRAVKLKSSAESWGDAQSFRHVQKIYQSDARIFHYGHVRDFSKYQDKKRDILKLYHSDSKMAKYKRREQRFDLQTETLSFYGNHPLVMKKRILQMGDVWELENIPYVVIVGSESDYSQTFLEKIKTDKIIWYSNYFDVPPNDRRRAVIARPLWWNKFWRRSNVPEKMRSPLARSWGPETLLMLKLSEKGVGLTTRMSHSIS